MMEGLRSPSELVVIVVILLAYGCPLQAIVHAYGLDERTVAEWQKRAGKHCQQVHQAIVEQANVATPQVQADEMRAKGRKLVIWMGMALDASSRFWRAGVVSVNRDRHLADLLLQQVRRCCRRVPGLLICTDGWNAYPQSIVRAFRDKVKRTAGRGRCCLQVWPELCSVTILKQIKKKRVVQVRRKLTWGVLEKAQHLLTLTPGCQPFHTSLIERFNATMRERLASLTRKCRHAAQRLETIETGMYLVGSTYNFCWPHHELSSRKHFGSACTPAMAAGLTNHIWSVWELLCFQVAPAPWVEPKRRGRPRKATKPDTTVPKRPRGRPRKLA